MSSKYISKYVKKFQVGGNGTDNPDSTATELNEDEAREKAALQSKHTFGRVMDRAKAAYDSGWTGFGGYGEGWFADDKINDLQEAYDNKEDCSF